VCDALGIDKPFVLGASFGAMVAMRYLERHPGHAAKVVLVCGSAHVDVDEQLAVLVRRGVPSDVRAAAEAFWRNPSPETGSAFFSRSASLYAVTGPLPLSRSVANYDVMFHFLQGEMQTMNLLSGLAGTTTSTLVLGGLDDPITPARGMTAIAAAIGPTATLELIPNASHVVWVDRPDSIETIRRWLLQQ
jgi:pimeloyl-ACP methyl ester carboxylesterase